MKQRGVLVRVDLSAPLKFNQMVHGWLAQPELEGLICGDIIVDATTLLPKERISVGSWKDAVSFAQKRNGLFGQHVAEALMESPDVNRVVEYWSRNGIDSLPFFGSSWLWTTTNPNSVTRKMKSDIMIPVLSLKDGGPTKGKFLDLGFRRLENTLPFCTGLPFFVGFAKQARHTPTVVQVPVLSSH